MIDGVPDMRHHRTTGIFLSTKDSSAIPTLDWASPFRIMAWLVAMEYSKYRIIIIFQENGLTFYSLFLVPLPRS